MSHEAGIEPDLVAAVEADAIASGAEAIVAGTAAGDDLHGPGAGHLGVVGGVGLEEIVIADVHHPEVIGNEAETIGSGRQMMAGKFEGRFREQVTLIFLLNGGGVAGGIDEDGEGIGAVGEVDACGVAQLGVGGFPCKEDGIGQDLGGCGGGEDGVSAGLGGGQECQRE